MIKQLQIPIELLIRGKYQPRRDFNPESLQELANSIKEHGLIEPIIVRQTKDQQYEIIAGERRWRACQLIGLDQVRCEIRKLNDEQVAAITIIENIQREELNPIEEARAYQQLINEFDYIHEEIAATVGKSREKITNSLRLLKLDERVQELIIQKQISEGHGKVLAGLPENAQYKLAKECIEKNWSTRALEKYAKKVKASPQDVLNDPNIKALETKLSDHIGNPVKIDYEHGKGKLHIDFHNLEILEGLFKKMGFNLNGKQK